VSKITGYTALTSAATNDVVPIVDVSDTSMAATGTTKKITLANLQEAIDNDTDTNIAANGAQASGTVGLNADAGHVHPAVGQRVPSDNGLLAANAPPATANGGSGALTAGTLYLQKVWIRQPFTATTMWMVCSSAGSGASTHTFIGLWNSSGTLLTGSADVSASLGTAGVVSAAWTTPQALTVGMGFVWAGFIVNYATTQPGFRTLSSNSVSAMNVNLSAANYAACVNGTGLTALANITPSSNTQPGSAFPLWTGIS